MSSFASQSCKVAQIVAQALLVNLSNDLQTLQCLGLATSCMGLPRCHVPEMQQSCTAVMGRLTRPFP